MDMNENIVPANHLTELTLKLRNVVKIFRKYLDRLPNIWVCFHTFEPANLLKRVLSSEDFLNRCILAFIKGNYSRQSWVIQEG